jgi:hypothetical protein
MTIKPSRTNPTVHFPPDGVNAHGGYTGGRCTVGVGIPLSGRKQYHISDRNLKNIMTSIFTLF